MNQNYKELNDLKLLNSICIWIQQNSFPYVFFWNNLFFPAWENASCTSGRQTSSCSMKDEIICWIYFILNIFNNTLHRFFSVISAMHALFEFAVEWQCLFYLLFKNLSNCWQIQECTEAKNIFPWNYNAVTTNCFLVQSIWQHEKKKKRVFFHMINTSKLHIWILVYCWHL